MIEFLLSKIADIEAQSNQNFTPLAYAVFKNDYETVKMLVDNKANVNHRAPDGITVLHVAAGGAARGYCCIVT